MRLREDELLLLKAANFEHAEEGECLFLRSEDGMTACRALSSYGLPMWELRRKGGGLVSQEWSLRQALYVAGGFSQVLKA